jgi:hypothetical protein
LAPDLDWSLWESFILGEFVEILPELGRLVSLAEDVNACLDAKETIFNELSECMIGNQSICAKD